MAALAQAMIDGGIRSGMPEEVAVRLTLQTMKGTAELLLTDGIEPEELYRKVATPNGTTEAGWRVMRDRGVPQAISDGIVAASNRAAELAAEAAKLHEKGARREP
jgi:pyrroline-5-carboxylate reductase